MSLSSSFLQDKEILHGFFCHSLKSFRTYSHANIEVGCNLAVNFHHKTSFFKIILPNICSLKENLLKRKLPPMEASKLLKK